MSWASSSRKLLLLGLGGGTATIVAYQSINSRETPVKNDHLPDFGSTHPPFRSSLPLGKVLASWTTNYEPTVKWDANWDRREPDSLIKPSKTDSPKDEKDAANELEKLKPTATRHLFFVRHGQYVMSKDGDEFRILTKLGQEQAELTGNRFKVLDFPYDKLINSTMTRATETADIVARSLPDVPRTSCDLLREGAPIPPEPPIGHWKPEKHFYEDGARIEAAFRKHVHRASPEQIKDSYEVYVCHANVIRYFVCRGLQLPPEAWLRMSLYNGSITHMMVRPSGRVIVRSVGDAGHMPKDSLTTT